MSTTASSRDLNSNHMTYLCSTPIDQARIDRGRSPRSHLPEKSKEAWLIQLVMRKITGTVSTDVRVRVSSLPLLLEHSRRDLSEHLDQSDERRGRFFRRLRIESRSVFGVFDELGKSDEPRVGRSEDGVAVSEMEQIEMRSRKR